MVESCSCEELNKKIDQLIEQTRSCSAVRGKRAPSEWQKFLHMCLPSKTGLLPERIKACSTKYKQRR